MNDELRWSSWWAMTDVAEISCIHSLMHFFSPWRFAAGLAPEWQTEKQCQLNLRAAFDMLANHPCCYWCLDHSAQDAFLHPWQLDIANQEEPYPHISKMKGPFNGKKITESTVSDVPQIFLRADAFTQSIRCTRHLLRTNAFTHRHLHTQMLWLQKFWHREYWTVFTHSSFYTKSLHRATFAHRSLYTEKPLHKAGFTQRSRCTEQFLHTDTVTQSSFSTQKPLHRTRFVTHRIFLTHRRFFTEKVLHTRGFAQWIFTLHTVTFTLHAETSTQRSVTQISFHTEVLNRETFPQSTFLYTEVFAHRSFYTKRIA